MQVERAFENLTSNATSSERDVRFSINCGANNAKGILLRAGVIDRPKDYAITVEPNFMDSENVGMYILSIILLCKQLGISRYVLCFTWLFFILTNILLRVKISFIYL